MTVPPPSGATAITVLEQRLEQLPLLPAIVTELLSLDPEADEYFDRLLHLAEQDPSFAARVLRCANSAASAPLSPILSLREAFLRLGTRQCAQLVLAVAVTKAFVPRTAGQRFLWIHALQTALFARMFCEAISGLRRVREQGYVCGLLHDIGRFLQFDGAPTDLDHVDAQGWATPEELVDVEREALGYDHARLGWSACNKWSLPSAIGEVILHHHDSIPARCVGTPDLVRVVQWADRLSMLLMCHPDRASGASSEFAQWLAREHASLGPSVRPGDPQPWPAEAGALYTESMNLARQLRLA